MKLLKALIAAFVMLGAGAVYAAIDSGSFGPAPVESGATTGVWCPPFCD